MSGQPERYRWRGTDRRGGLRAGVSVLTADRLAGEIERRWRGAWQLAGPRATSNDRLRRCAHTLGWGGHFLTKSRRYSVTFGQLRRARLEHRRQQRHPDGERDPWGRPLDETVILVLKTWAYDGTGYTIASGAEQAVASAARAREHDHADRAA